MTGFGVAEYKDDELTIRVELRSVNNRFLKIDSRLPEVLQSFETEIERPIRGKIARGTVLLYKLPIAPAGTRVCLEQR